MSELLDLVRIAVTCIAAVGGIYVSYDGHRITGWVLWIFSNAFFLVYFFYIDMLDQGLLYIFWLATSVLGFCRARKYDAEKKRLGLK